MLSGGEASAQGKTAGANAAGEETFYEPPSMGLSFHGMNTALYAIGDTGERAGPVVPHGREKRRGQETV